jgi:hypothetical protein
VLHAGSGTSVRRLDPPAQFRYDKGMAFPVKICAVCGEEFELRPGKPGFANRCPSCSEPDASEAGGNFRDSGASREQDAARRNAMRDLLYRKDS